MAEDTNDDNPLLEVVLGINDFDDQISFLILLVLNRILYRLMSLHVKGFPGTPIVTQFFGGFQLSVLCSSRFIRLVDHLNRVNLKMNQKYQLALEILGRVQRLPGSILCTFIAPSYSLSSYSTSSEPNESLSA